MFIHHAVLDQVFIHLEECIQTPKFARRHQHDLTSTQVRTPADFVFHHSQDIPEKQLDLKTLMH